jgi:tellurite resistance protein TerC
MLQLTRKIVIAALGTSVLVVGAAMIVLPGPAFVVIPAGLAILGLEFAWARRWLTRVKEYGDRAVQGVRQGRSPRA